MVKSIELIPNLNGPELMLGVLSKSLKEMLELAGRADLECFLRKHRDLKDSFGLTRFIQDSKFKPVDLYTNLGLVTVELPIVIDRAPALDPKAHFVSSFIPSRTRIKLCYDAPLVWRYLEGLATGDFDEVRSLLLGSTHREPDERLGFWLNRVFESRHSLWHSRTITSNDYPIIWVDKVDLKRRGPNKNSRLFVACGINVNSKVTLLGTYKSANSDDYMGWSHLFGRLKSQGLTNLPPVTGITCRDMIKGIKQAFPKFRLVRPGEAEINLLLSRLPKKRQQLGLVICDDIRAAKNGLTAAIHVANFTRNFAMTDPRPLLDFLDPDRFIRNLNGNFRRRPAVRDRKRSTL
jgi:hypothetical protein